MDRGFGPPVQDAGGRERVQEIEEDGEHAGRLAQQARALWNNDGIWSRLQPRFLCHLSNPFCGHIKLGIYCLSQDSQGCRSGSGPAQEGRARRACSACCTFGSDKERRKAACATPESWSRQGSGRQCFDQQVVCADGEESLAAQILGPGRVRVEVQAHICVLARTGAFCRNGRFSARGI